MRESEKIPAARKKGLSGRAAAGGRRHLAAGRILAVFLAAVAGVTVTPAICYGGETARELKTVRLAGNGQAAEVARQRRSETEEAGRAAEKENGVLVITGGAKDSSSESLMPIDGDQVEDGSYPVEVESSSSMFRIVKAQLTAAGGEMRAVITLSGTGYLRLFMGTGEEAAEAPEAEWIPYVEDAEGAYTYEIPVKALNQELDCAAYSRRKETWYDRKIIFRSDSLPPGALKEKAGAGDELAGIEDGSYEIQVELTGGTGRATVESPAVVTVTEGQATVRLVWSSPHYDYMKVDGVRYLPVGGDGNSVFEIPVPVLDVPFAVTADTTAMGTPHEIEYELRLLRESLKPIGEAAMDVSEETGDPAALEDSEKEENAADLETELPSEDIQTNGKNAGLILGAVFILAVAVGIFCGRRWKK